MNLSLLAIALASLLAVFLLFKRKATAPNNTGEERSDWTMFDWVDEAGPKILQSRDFKPSDARGRFSVAIIIEWKYGTTGFPNQTVMESIYEVEAALGTIRNDRSAIHVHTLTGNGLREWCYYAANYPAFEVRFNQLVASFPKLPIEISFQADPKWDYWQNVKSIAAGQSA